MKKTKGDSFVPNSLKNQVALITGATQGIGLAIARALADEGCNLIICGRDRARLERTKAELVAKDVEVTAISCDVREEKSVEQMFSAIRKSPSKLDILINSAGIAHAFRPVS